MAFDRDKFLVELGFTPRTVGPGYREIPRLATQDEQLEAIREQIGTLSTDQFLNAIEQADPSVSQLTEFLKTEPAMAEALQDAIVQNPNMLPGIIQLAQSGRLQQMGEMLGSADPDSPLAGIATQQTINALRTIANDPTKDVTLLTNLIDQAGAMDFGAFLDFFKNIMDGMPLGQAVTTLIDDMGVTGAQAEAVEHVMASPFVGGIFEMTMGGTTADGGLYHEDSGLRTSLRETWNHIQNLPGVDQIIGNAVTFQTDVAATVTYTPATFSAEYGAAISGINFSDGASLNEWSETFEAVKDIAPDSLDEINAIQHLIRTDADVRAQFNSFGTMTQADVVREMEEMIETMANDDVTPRVAASGFNM